MPPRPSKKKNRSGFRDLPTEHACNHGRKSGGAGHRNHAPISHRIRSAFGLPTRSDHFWPCQHFLPSRKPPDTSRAFAILANSWPAGSLLVPVASGNDGTSPQPSEASTHRWPSPSPTADGPQTTHDLAARSGHFRRCHDREARTNLGPPATSLTDGPQMVHRLFAHFDHLPVTATICHPDVQTNHELQPTSPAGGPPARCLLRPWRQLAIPTSRHTSGRRHLHHQTAFGRTSPNLSTADAPQPVAATAAAAAIAATLRQIRGPFPDKTHLSRHDKQAY